MINGYVIKLMKNGKEVLVNLENTTKEVIKFMRREKTYGSTG